MPRTIQAFSELLTVKCLYGIHEYMPVTYSALAKSCFHLLSELSNTTAGSGSTLITLMTVRRLLESQSDLYHELRSLSFISFGSGREAGQTWRRHR